MIALELGDTLNACSFYRGVEVFRNHKYMIPTSSNWATYLPAHIQYLLRPWNQFHVNVRQVAALSDVPNWTDYDDDFLSIPAHNPSLPGMVRQEQGYKGMVRSFIQAADQLTVSTEHLANLYSELNKNTTVIPNAFNDIRFKPEFVRSDAPVIMWRGSETHRKDVDTYKEEIESLGRELPDHKWIIYGDTKLGLGLEHAVYFASTDIIFYYRSLKSLAPSIFIVPLEFDDFNRSKSNIAWIEATYAGAVAVCPDLPEFRRPGVALYKTPAEFKSQVKALTESSEYRKELYNLSVEYIIGNLLLTDVNKKRDQIISKLT
jgi:glycosyltransferase involved in cell wall biosynthesis